MNLKLQLWLHSRLGFPIIRSISPKIESHEILFLPMKDIKSPASHLED